MNMGMNLTGLADVANAKLALEGRPLEIDLDNIVPDPANPRAADDETLPAAVEAQEELDADVAQRGIKSPISIRPHPTLKGKYIINYGHRRHKSAQRNALRKIPAFVDEAFDSYDQVNENELRSGISTRARALFIKSRLDAGDSKSEIAERLHKKNQAFVTEHLALIDAPDCVYQAYAAGITSARTLYDLRQVWEEFPEQTDAWCGDVARITREGIKEAVERFRHDEADASESSDPMQTQPQVTALLPSVLRHDEKSRDQLKTVPVPDAGMPGSEERSTVARTQQDRRASPIERKAGRLKSQSLEASGGMSADCSPVARGIKVHYKGMLAWLTPNTTVSIVMEGQDGAIEVPLSELTFDGC
jgi:ParB family chromosome partitioning protein